jgi:hypothetical protein
MVATLLPLMINVDDPALEDEHLAAHAVLLADHGSRGYSATFSERLTISLTFTGSEDLQ